MPRASALSMPAPHEETRTIAALLAILGALWAVATRMWKAWGRRRRRRALESKAIRYLLDAQRQDLRAVGQLAATGRLYDDVFAEIVTHRGLIDDVRDQLWVADGHESQREEQRRVEGIVEAISRTQRIRMKAHRPSRREHEGE